MGNKSLFIIALLFWCLRGYAQGILLTDSTASVLDNAIFSENNNSNGAGGSLFTGRNGLGNSRRALIKFNTLSLPPDSFKSINVRIHINQVSNTSARTFSLHKLTSNWGEGTSNSAGGGGAPPSTNDATWNFRFFNSQSWATAGGDYQAIPSASVSISDLGFYNFTGPGLLGDYKSWILNPSSNFGWIIIGDEVVNNSAKRFDSKEGIASDIPKIFAEYNPSALPMALVNFKAKLIQNHVNLSWQTMNEFNNRLFRVEHSADANIFDSIGNIPGAGTSTQVRYYSFDHLSSSNVNFYRLASIDYNGAIQYSPVLQFSLRKDVTDIKVMPNPAEDFLRIAIAGNPGLIRYVIYNNVAAVVKKGKLQHEIIRIDDLRPGLYYVYFTFNDKIHRSKFIKK